jgi:carbamoyltransferase
MLIGPRQTFVLSCYLSPPGDFSILASRHDQSVALWRRQEGRVELVRLWELERITGQKHHRWPLFTVERAQTFINALLETEGLSLDDVEVVYGTPGLPNCGTIAVPQGAERFPMHSLSHLFSALLLDTVTFKNESIFGMAMDSGPDTVLDARDPEFWYAGCHSDRGVISYLPMSSPAPLYSAAALHFGLEPGSLMALASASRTAIKYDVESAASRLRLLGGRVPPWSEAANFVAELIAETERQLSCAAVDSAFSYEDNVCSAVMKLVQRACEAVAIRNVEALCDLSDARPEESFLAIAGGFGLNCPTNTLLLDKFGFRGLLASPCANDSGQALGLGLLGLYGSGVFESETLEIKSPFLGEPLRDTKSAMSEFAPWIASVAEFEPEQFVADIADSVVAWVDGNAEVGPRALGHRSLLGDPRSEAVKDLLNSVKQRQWWRPVAPVVLEEYASQWFVQARPSPYMLEAVRVRPEVAARVPAVRHLDGSARHQTISKQVDPALHAAIEAFREATGVPLLCNTSLNDKGEPNVNTVAEALTFCLNKGIAVAYVEGKRIELLPRGEADPPTSGPRVRSTSYFAGQEADRDAIWHGWNRRGYSDASIFLLNWSVSIRALRLPVEKLNELADYQLATDDEFARSCAEFLRDYGPGSTFVRSSTDLPKRVDVI